MRIVLIGVSHWHMPFFLEPALAMPEIAIVGMSDPDRARAEAFSEPVGCKVWTDYREMCAELKPDFAFALARHCDMAELARYLIDLHIPFAMEKPCGVSAAEVRELAVRAQHAGVFVAVPFVFRYCGLSDVIREVAGTDAIQYLSFKFIGGMIERYRQMRCEWMLDRATAGGGALINLGIHFLDLCRVLVPDATFEVAASLMSNANARLDIEDHAVVLLHGGPATCLVETGYLYPAPNSVFDLHYSIRTERHYFAVRDAETLEITDNSRRQVTRKLRLTNSPHYPTFVADTLRRLRAGEPPIAGLADAAAAMELVDVAYALSPLPAGIRRHIDLPGKADPGVL